MKSSTIFWFTLVGCGAAAPIMNPKPTTGGDSAGWLLEDPGVPGKPWSLDNGVSRI